VIEDTALQQNAPLMHLTSQDTHRPPLDSIELPLAGPHQRLNAAVAIAAVRSLASQIPVSDEAIRAGLSCVHWPGRLQLVSRPSGQKILLDGAHNKAGAEILAAALKDEFRFPELTLLLGILRDKDLAGICETLAPLASRILLVPVPSERSATPQELGEICRRINPDARIINCSSLSEALMKTGNDAFVAIAGSLYLIGEAMELLGPSPATTYGERELNEWGETTSNSKLQTPNFRETSNSKNVQKLPMG
jgi:dihydrofolate synthase/folylpolyglutamate synthase